MWRLTEEGGAECLAVATGHTLSVGSVAFGQGVLQPFSSDDICVNIFWFHYVAFLYVCYELVGLLTENMRINIQPLTVDITKRHFH